MKTNKNGTHYNDPIIFSIFAKLKILAFILSFTIFFTTVVPCDVYDNCDSTEHTAKKPGQEEKKDCGDCSPFSACCSAHAYIINHESFIQSPISFVDKKSYNGFYFSSKSEYYFSFFQPPRIAS